MWNLAAHSDVRRQLVEQPITLHVGSVHKDLSVKREPAAVPQKLVALLSLVDGDEARPAWTIGDPYACIV